jgi:hypothetical protein
MEGSDHEVFECAPGAPRNYSADSIEAKRGRSLICLLPREEGGELFARRNS